MNPWEGDHPPVYLGHVLRADDLELPAAALNRLDVQRTADDRVCVLFAEGKVRAVVVRQPHHATTGRGLKILAGMDDLYRIYDEGVTEKVPLHPDEDRTGKGHVDVRRSDPLGLAVEIQKVDKTTRVTAITLYPPKKDR